MKTKAQYIFVQRGFLIGLFFPVLAILLCQFSLTPNDYPFSLKTLHADFPLLWIIDSAPIVLAIVSFIVGYQVNKTDKRNVKTIEDFNKTLVEKNDQLEKLIDEKEVLLKEIHHRVKNNLQVITSLLSLQASFIEDEKSKGLFRYCQYRVNSMAMVHQMLYQSKDLSQINYSEYVRNLLEGLRLSMIGKKGKVQLDIDIPELSLNIDTAIPLGLLINEIATNAFKYGLKEDGGTFHVRIEEINHGMYQMEIGDDGKGFPENVDFRSMNSLGLVLIHRLTLQLKGSIEMDRNKKGTNYIVLFEEITQGF